MKIVFFCALLSLVESQYIHSFTGPFDIIFHKFEWCPGSIGDRRVFDMNPAHPTRDRRNKYVWWYNGNVSSAMDINDEVYGEANVASWSSRGGWTPNAYRFSADRLCSLAQYLLPYLPQERVRNATASLGMTVDDLRCPFPKGNYTIKDLYINLDISEFAPPMVPYGKWRTTLTVAKTKATPVVLCGRVYADTVPKPGVLPYMAAEGQVRKFTGALGLSTVDDFVCPIPQGNYTIKDMFLNLDISHLVPPIVPYGKWRNTITMAKDKTSSMQFCVKIYADTVPKPGGKTGKLPAHFNMSMLSILGQGARPG